MTPRTPTDPAPVFFDTETFLIQPGQLAPPMVCVQFIRGRSPEAKARILHTRDHRTTPTLADWLASGALIVGHNVAFDLAVVAVRNPELLPLIFEAYAQDRVTDTQIRQILIDIGEGTIDQKTLDLPDGTRVRRDYSLAVTAARYGGQKDAADPWRLKYGTLIDTPVKAWPPEAREYAEHDAEATRLVWEGQEAFAPLLEDQYRQTRAAWWLHLAACWGVTTDPEAVEVAIREAEALIAADRAVLEAAGLVRPDGTRDTKKAKARMIAACKAEGVTPVITDAGLKGSGAKYSDQLPAHEAWKIATARPEVVSLSADACEQVEDQVLHAYARFGSASTLRSRIALLRAGHSGGVIQPAYQPLKATGRTSCRDGDPDGATTGFQIQNPPRVGGVRECFVPRPGFLFAMSDYSGMELCTWAQVCLWFLKQSKLAAVLNDGEDPHAMMAANILGWTYSRVKGALQGAEGPEKRAEAKAARQLAKVPNFGYPGGMGPATLRQTARASYGLHLTIGQCEDLRVKWRETWPEAAAYFEFVNTLLHRGGGEATIRQPRSNRIRAGLGYTVACNTFFQGLAADAAKAAGFEISRECYTEPTSPLYGSRIWAFIHDEFGLEVPEVGASAAALRADQIMRDVAQEWIPDVKITTEPALMRRWYKAAEPVWNDAGELVPWEPTKGEK